jgi:RNA polymerase sigma factor (TIGR02999 family)
MPAQPDLPPASEVTALLAAVRDGDSAAGERLFAIVYGDLKRIARRQLRGSAGGTLTPTSLVHEAYLRLARPGNQEQQDRVHFFAVAARAMRQIAVDHARRRAADRRGGGAAAVTLQDDDSAGAPPPAVDLLALDVALERLAEMDQRLVRLVEWRFFAGLTVEEIAAVLDVSTRTVKRDWRKARAILYREITGRDAAAAGLDDD